MSTENKWYADLWIIKLLSPTLSYFQFCSGGHFSERAEAAQ